MFLLLFTLACCVATCAGHEDSAGQKALSAYQGACLALQHLADWLSVVSRVTGTLARSVTSRTVALPESHSRSKREAADLASCSSLKSLGRTAEAYVKLQGELLGLKAALGGGLIKTGKIRLEETSKVLQERVRHLDALNRTSSEILRRLRAGSEVLASQVEAVISRARSFVGEVAADDDLRHDLRETRGLLQRGDFFQSIGRMLDRMLLPVPATREEES